jgi:hypothetical protein
MQDASHGFWQLKLDYENSIDIFIGVLMGVLDLQLHNSSNNGSIKHFITLLKLGL